MNFQALQGDMIHNKSKNRQKAVKLIFFKTWPESPANHWMANITLARNAAARTGFDV